MSGSAPQFPDPLGFREVDRPGATAHKAGMDLVRRVAALEQGALGRPGPGVADGSVPTANASQAGGVAWKNPFAEFPTVVDSRAANAVLTTTTTQIISGLGSCIDYNAAGGVGGLVYIAPTDYDGGGSPFKVQARAIVTLLSNSATGVDWTGGLYRATSISGGAIAGTATVATSTIGSSLGANTAAAIITAWTDVSTTGYYFVGHNPNSAASSGNARAHHRIELRIVGV